MAYSHHWLCLFVIYMLCYWHIEISTMLAASHPQICMILLIPLLSIFSISRPESTSIYNFSNAFEWRWYLVFAISSNTCLTIVTVPKSGSFSFYSKEHNSRIDRSLYLYQYYLDFNPANTLILSKLLYNWTLFQN